MRSPHRRGHHLLIEAAAQLETGHKTTHASHYRIAGPATDPCLRRLTTGSVHGQEGTLNSAKAPPSRQMRMFVALSQLGHVMIWLCLPVAHRLMWTNRMRTVVRCFNISRSLSRVAAFLTTSERLSRSRCYPVRSRHVKSSIHAMVPGWSETGWTIRTRQMSQSLRTSSMRWNGTARSPSWRLWSRGILPNGLDQEIRGGSAYWKAGKTRSFDARTSKRSHARLAACESVCCGVKAMSPDRTSCDGIRYVDDFRRSRPGLSLLLLFLVSGVVAALVWAAYRWLTGTSLTVSLVTGVIFGALWTPLFFIGLKRMGLMSPPNGSKFVCAVCGQALPLVRRPSNRRQFLWGGWTCPNCGTEVDRRGGELADDQ